MKGSPPKDGRQRVQSPGPRATSNSKPQLQSRGFALQFLGGLMVVTLMTAGTHVSAQTTNNWVGGSGPGWHTAANWSTGQVPTAADDVLININANATVVIATVTGNRFALPFGQVQEVATVFAAAGTPPIAFATLTLGNAAGTTSPKFVLGTTIQSGGNLTLNRNATLMQATSSQLTINGDVTVNSGATLTHVLNIPATAATGPLYSVNLHATGNFTLSAGASVMLNGRGYPAYIGNNGTTSPGEGPGAGGGGPNNENGGGGGGYGGAGGASSGGNLGGASYGLASNPADLGSSGGMGDNYSSNGAGGGLAILTVGGVATLNGLVSANGTAGPASLFHGAGGGAGGGIKIAANSVVFGGTLQANGGPGGNANGAGRHAGGGGAGGRIAIFNQPAGLVVAGGIASANGAAGGSPNGQAGGAGSIMIQTDQTRPVLSNFAVSSDGVNFANGVTTVLNTANAWVQVTLLDAQSGLAPASLSVQLSTDGGGAWMSVPVSVPGLLQGTTQPVTATASNMSVAQFVPAGTNLIAFTISDMAGNVASSTFTIQTSTIQTTNSWIGGSGPGWNTAANWSAGRIPTILDDVVIDSNANATVVIATVTGNRFALPYGQVQEVATVFAAAGTPPIAFATLTLGNAAGTTSPKFVLGTTIQSGGNLTLNRNATLMQATSSQLTINGDVTVNSGATLTHVLNIPATAATGPLYSVNLHATGNFTLSAGASVMLNGRGYPAYIGNNGTTSPGEGPGAGGGGPNNENGGGGGGYGGAGGASSGGNLGGASYGLASNPADLGSSGGMGDNYSSNGAGGGLAILTVGGVATLNGLVSANGTAGPASLFHGAGGGAGGGIKIAANSVVFGGTLQANGGPGGNANGAGRHAGGGGAGGRIAIFNQPAGLVVAGGIASANGAAGGVPNGQAGGPGSTTLQTVTAPDAILDLSLSAINFSSVTLRWTAPASAFPLTAYDLRRATVPITAANFPSATQIPAPAPASPGTVQTIAVSGVTEAAFYAAIVSRNVSGGVSSLSNVVSLTRSTVTVGSGAEISFFASQPVSVTLVSTTSSVGTVVLGSATAQGLTLASNIYDLGPEGAVFDPPAQIVFRYSPQTLADLSIMESDLALYEFFPSSGWVRVPGQVLNTGGQTVSASITTLASIFGLFGPRDLLPPRTAINIGTPSAGSTPTFVSTLTAIAFTVVDDALIVGDGAGVGVAETRFSIDGGSFAAFTSPFFIVAEGTHTVRFFSIDLRGAQEAVNTALLAVDNTPPSTRLTVNGSTVPAGPVAAIEGSFFGFVAADPVSNGVASGLESTEFSVNAGPFAVFSSTFSLAIGSHTVAFRSKDNVRNLEALQTALVTVVPPRVVFLDLDPDTLNLKSQGKWVTAYLETLGAQTAADIATDTVRISKINGQAVAPIFIDPKGPVSVGDSDADGLLDLAVKFDRARLIAVLPVEAQVKVTVEGRFKDGQSFETDDFIRTIRPGNVPAHLGGFVNHPTNAKVYLPPGALSSDTDVSVLRISAASEGEEQPRDQAARAGRIGRVGVPYEFGPEGSRFNAPVTLTLPYEASSLGGAREGDLRVAYWNPATRNWELLNSTIDPTARTVSAPTTHFSLYQVVSIEAQAVAAFSLLQAYAFPNPVRGQNTVTIRVQPGLADSVAVRVYDVAGRKVHESSNFVDRGAFDDGNGLGAQFTYDHVWDVSGVGSGVYTYAVTARKAGQSDIRKTGKVGIIK